MSNMIDIPSHDKIERQVRNLRIFGNLPEKEWCFKVLGEYGLKALAIYRAIDAVLLIICDKKNSRFEGFFFPNKENAELRDAINTWNSAHATYTFRGEQEYGKDIKGKPFTPMRCPV